MAVGLKSLVQIPPLVAAPNTHVTEIHRVVSDLQLRYRYSLELRDLGGIATALIDQVQLRIQTVSPLYKYTTDVAARPHLNSEWYYIEGDKVSKVTLTFIECADWAVSKYFMLWRQLQINQDGTYNPPEHYKHDVSVGLLDSSGENASYTRKILYQRCFPEEISATEVDYSNSNPIMVEVTLSTDGILFQ